MSQAEDNATRWLNARSDVDDTADRINEHVPGCPACVKGRPCMKLKQLHLLERAYIVLAQTVFGIMSQYPGKE